MGRLIRDDRKATVTQITARYNQGMQNTISERTRRRTLKQMGYSSRTVFISATKMTSKNIRQLSFFLLLRREVDELKLLSDDKNDDKSYAVSLLTRRDGNIISSEFKLITDSFEYILVKMFLFQNLILFQNQATLIVLHVCFCMQPAKKITKDFSCY